MVTVEHIKYVAGQASAATWPFCALATILFFMRIFSCWRLKNQPRAWEDLILLVSWCFEIIQAGIFQKQLNEAKALDLARAPETIPGAVFWAILMNNWSYFSIEFPKIGIALMATNLFRAGLWTRVAIWSLCIIVNVMAAVGFIITWVMCDPVQGQWDPYTHPNVKCWPRSVQIDFACVTCGLSSLFNIALCIYPASVVWGLQMPRWKKISTMCLTGLGLVAFIFSLIKLYYMSKLADSPEPIELIYKSEDLGIWNRIENDFVLMVGLLPFVPGFFKSFGEFAKSHTSSISYRLRSKTGESQSRTYDSKPSDVRDSLSDGSLVDKKIARSF
ncbi:hypothetical protein N7478_011258 [Penicillium angulare]|uniref:uncharacterized protein n=1 Tax=Penicillium angulare TaxID=116970 RepID=UPI00254171EA|nr:uncharacterized protein N7478_011258 [Penicillium angulare]KAJ5263653.1 hypothetical protein N7478_011258 [Penicillium angulare]